MEDKLPVDAMHDGNLILAHYRLQFQGKLGRYTQEDLTRLLADLRHLCARTEGLSFPLAVVNAANQYNKERMQMFKELQSGNEEND